MPPVTALGLGKTMERKLHSVGIHSAGDLIEIGSKEAVCRLKAQCFSQTYSVRSLTPADVDIILPLCAGNKLFYQYHPPFVTRESILADMTALPPGKTMADKHYMGYFSQAALVALMDLILDYPAQGVAFIGLFMVHPAWQGRGVGSCLVEECAACLTRHGYRKIRLAIDQGNPQSEAFWQKNHFVKTGEAYPHDASFYLPMERSLALPPV